MPMDVMKDVQILLGNILSGAVKQEQGEISPNHARALLPISVHRAGAVRALNMPARAHENASPPRPARENAYGVRSDYGGGGEGRLPNRNRTVRNEGASSA